ncbi:DNA helicase-2 / ATP-dependent DNA helicase PcrA [Lachnospiraceae bacterium XBB2008]|nr:DNA helicase-2 / ATP-dependent DNA helicase PcrA [Lachnospiraceae bacterium XBB2008]
MAKMNADQQRAVNFRDGTLLLLAGPGSGKTTVLTHRIRALMEAGVKDSDILVITFTRAAALEMQERFLQLIAPDDAQVTFGTFHAIFYSILRNHRAYRRVVPISDKDKLNMIKRAVEMSGLKDECADFDDLVGCLGLISSCKNNGNDPDDFVQDMFDKQAFISLFKAYGGLLNDFGLIDFDDMINLCLALLRDDEGFRKYWQGRFKYILIDEFQDISTNQYELVRLLAYPENNIFAVGDDDQSIYAFRGANVALMRRLLNDIPGAEQDLLSVNYRSSEQIVSFATQIIRANTDRFEKRIESGGGTGEEVHVNGFKSKEDHNGHITGLIRIAFSDGLTGPDIAILARTNRQGAEYAALLRACGIECEYNDTHIPFSSGYMRDICAYMALAAGDRSRGTYLRIVNKPLRYIRREAMPHETVERSDLFKYYSSDMHMRKRIDEMFRHIDRIRNMRPHLALRYICNTIGYDAYVKENVTPDKYREYVEEKEAFLLLIKEADNYREVEELLEVIRGKAAESSSKKVPGPGVRIMTYHGSKGLEFDTVILPDVNENKIPSRSAHTPAEVEEERRMFYVAMTRAKKHLHILFRTDENLKPSRFIVKLKS